MLASQHTTKPVHATTSIEGGCTEEVRAHSNVGLLKCLTERLSKNQRVLTRCSKMRSGDRVIKREVKSSLQDTVEAGSPSFFVGPFGEVEGSNS